MTFMLRRNKSLRKFSPSEMFKQFEYFDQDKDGFIDCEEMIALVNELHINQKFPTNLIQKLFHQADSNGDGKITFEGWFRQNLQILKIKWFQNLWRQ